MKLLIFSSKRQIRAFYEGQKNKNCLIDRAISVDEFLENVCLQKGETASFYESLLLMQEAAVKVKRLESELGISPEFFAFLKNYDYIFSFFRELSLEKTDILALKNNDYYAAYNEHLEILDALLKNYKENLKRENLSDILNFDYEINLDFLADYKILEYDLQGFLSRFEWDLLNELCTNIKVILSFELSRFNHDYFKNLFPNLDLKIDHVYKIELNSKKILSKNERKNNKAKIKLQAFEQRAAQMAFVRDELSNFMRAGISPENIALITPDEGYCELLRLLDKDKVLNFASGLSAQNTAFYKKLSALFEAGKDEEFSFFEGENYFEKCENFDIKNSLLAYFELDFTEFKTIFNENCEFEFFENFIKNFAQNENEEFKKLISKELFGLKFLAQKRRFKFRELLELFFTQFKMLKLSDTRGGKLTAMGLLESRGLEFDGVIIIDFNDDLIPKRNINELFLNNEIRKKAGLISHERRENLQRHYYESLFKSAKKVSICYVQNEEKSKSRFLEELSFECFYQNEFSQNAYLKALRLDYENSKFNLAPLDPPKIKHNIFEKPLSFSRLDCFLNKKREYFYKYILNIKPPRLENSIKSKLGSFVHEFLESFYKENSKNFCDEKVLLKMLNEKAKSAELSLLEREILKLKLIEFAKNENKRFLEGAKIIELEKRIDEKDFKLLNGAKIKILGQIDRIDELDGKFLILDYKSGKINEKSYQLAFYKALLDLDDENSSAYFYDLKDAILKDANQKSLKELDEILDELYLKKDEEIEFESSSEAKKYCPYKLLYEKDLK